MRADCPSDTVRKGANVYYSYFGYPMHEAILIPETGKQCLISGFVGLIGVGISYDFSIPYIVANNQYDNCL